MAACKEFGAECVMTSADHQSGTDRIAEAVAAVRCRILWSMCRAMSRRSTRQISINLPSLLVDNPKCQMATLVAGFESKEQIGDPNIVKVVVDKDGYAIYFSRSVIPYDRTAGGHGRYKKLSAASGNLCVSKRVFEYNHQTAADDRLKKSKNLNSYGRLKTAIRILDGKGRTYLRRH